MSKQGITQEIKAKYSIPRQCRYTKVRLREQHLLLILACREQRQAAKQPIFCSQSLVAVPHIFLSLYLHLLLRHLHGMGILKISACYI
jgi:hypothetical protein